MFLRIEVKVKAKVASVKVIEAAGHYRLRGAIDIEKVPALLKAVIEAEKDEDLLAIAREFGLTVPLR